MHESTSVLFAAVEAAEPAFRILGPVEVAGPRGVVRIPPGRQQVILASLLLEANQVVGTDQLVDTLWEVEPPSTARTQVQICVSRLRKTLADAGVAVSILTRPPGYQLRIAEGALDVQQFAMAVARARTAARQGHPAEASRYLRAAVGLWRGPCLNGIPGRSLRTRALRLEEDRLHAVETYLELDLGLGAHHELVGEIARLVHEHPLRERLRALLMLALYRSGRKAEALDVYRAGRDLLVDELGLEPGDELRSLEMSIHAGDASLLRAAGEPEPAAPVPGPEPAPAAVPRQLPADTADLVGREAQVRQAEDTLVGEGRGRAVGVVIVVGTPGVGKSTLAAHIGHRLADSHFPDGQLYCDLRGVRGEPDAAAGVLGRFLVALGIPGQVLPSGLDVRTEMYRTLLATRRVLVVLDNAVSESQVMPLLPGSATCAVVVTSRTRLTGVPGARQIELDVLDRERSQDLLGRVIGHDRIAREPEAAAALVNTVGGLPLALRIVAARLAARPHWSLASMVHRLSSERHRLDELAHGELTIRASLSLTHDGLDRTTRQLFGLLGLAEGPALPGWVAGAVLGDDRPFASDLVEPLVDVQMLDVVSVNGSGEFRYRFQDIIRLFAREQVMRQVDEAGQRAAVHRMLGGWLALAEQAHRRIYGGDYTLPHGTALRWQPQGGHVDELLADPMEWLDGELGNLRAAVSHSARLGLDELCWDLAVTSVTLFESRGYLDDWEQTHREALAATRLAGNTRGTAALLASLGTMDITRGRPAESRSSLETALRMFTEVGDPLGQALCHRDLGLLARQSGDDDGALTLYELALRGFDQVGDVVGRAIVLTQRTHVLMRTGRSMEATAQLAEAMDICQGVGYARGVATTMRRIGQVQLHRGEHELARRTLSEVLELVRRSRDVIGEGHLLHNLGEVSAAAGQFDRAREYFEEAVAVRERIMDHGGVAAVRGVLARLPG